MLDFMIHSCDFKRKLSWNDHIVKDKFQLGTMPFWLAWPTRLKFVVVLDNEKKET